jgi:hypothetical protein
MVDGFMSSHVYLLLNHPAENLLGEGEMREIRFIIVLVVLSLDYVFTDIGVAGRPGLTRRAELYL